MCKYSACPSLPDCPGNKPPGLFFCLNKHMRTFTALQHMALLKATNGYSVDTMGVKFHRVIEIANKAAQLTEPEVAILEHFVHSNTATLNNTVYYGDSIIHPVTHNKRDYYRQARTGQVLERKPGTGAHMKLKSQAKTPTAVTSTGRPRGRPRKTPK